MPLHPVLLSVLLALAAACASAPPVKAASSHTFVKRPARAPGCDFEVFEEREPPRPYGVLGKVPLRINEWVGAKGRKALLQDTACQAGADAVLLPRPAERRVMNERVRDYEAVFITWMDVPAPPAEDEAAPPPPPEDGAILVPVGPEWPGDTLGTEVRKGTKP